MFRDVQVKHQPFKTVEASFSWGLGGQWAAALWLELSYLWSRYHQVAFLMSTYAMTRQNFWRKITIFINLSKEETHPSHSCWFQHIWRLVRLDNLPKGQCKNQTYLKLLRLWVNHCHHPYPHMPAHISYNTSYIYSYKSHIPGYHRISPSISNKWSLHRSLSWQETHHRCEFTE